MSETANRFTTEALVIREMKVGESDRLVTLFTRDYGIIRAFASGAVSVKSRRCTATSLLSYSSFTLVKKKDTYKIREAVPIKIFFGSGCDIEQLALAQYFCELAAIFSSDGGEGAEFFRLILNSLYFLSCGKRTPALIKAITELRTAAVSGFMPDLVACDGCGKFEDDIMYFDFLNGKIYCGECKPENQQIQPVSKTVLSAMRHIVYSRFEKLYSFSIPKEQAEFLSDITGRYITVQSDRRFTALDFYESIKEKK